VRSGIALASAFIVFSAAAYAEPQRLPTPSERDLLRYATAQHINVSNASIAFFSMPVAWRSGSYAYWLGIWPKRDRSRFDCVKALIEMKAGRIVDIEEISFHDASACEGARQK
jgi:hypothetical protein